MLTAATRSSVSLPDYLQHFAPLIGDQRTAATFAAIIGGIIAAGSLVAARIAAHAPLFARLKEPGQRVRRFASGESTHRSQLDATHLVDQVAERALTLLDQTPPDQDLWLIIDGSELRKPHARAMPDLMKVRALDGHLVPGYRTINVIAVTPQARVLLFHHLFSSNEKDFKSESLEIQAALQQVSKLLDRLRPARRVTWIMDTGFDDIAVWRTIWEAEGHVVCRLKHLERLVEYRMADGTWQAGDVAAAADKALLRLGRFTSSMTVRRRGQPAAKEQPVTVVLSACRLRLSYESNVRREGPGEHLCQKVWLVRVEVEDSLMEPWYLLTDWPVGGAAGALRIFRMYRERWAVEDNFAFLKGLLGWEEVQMLDLAGIRTLVALGWVAAGYLYEVQGTWTEEDIEWLAKLGGWEEHTNRQPGKIALLRGLRSILDYLVTRAALARYRDQHGGVPPAVVALLGEKAAADL